MQGKLARYVLKQRCALVTETSTVTDEGMIADVAFHNLSSHNPHAHIMLTMRNIDKDGFSKKKNRDWNKRELLEGAIGKSWLSLGAIASYKTKV